MVSALSEMPFFKFFHLGQQEEESAQTLVKGRHRLFGTQSVVDSLGTPTPAMGKLFDGKFSVGARRHLHEGHGMVQCRVEA